MPRLGLLDLCIYFMHLTIANQVGCMEYFIPTSGDPCTSPPCYTLSEFAANSTLNLSCSITLILAPGRHYLNVDLTLSGLEYITILTRNSPTQIVCENNSHFTFDNFMSINVTNVNFLGCGDNKVTHTRDLVIYNTSFEGHNGSGTALLVEKTTARIIDCKFLSNTNGSYGTKKQLVGGALVSVNSNLTIEQSLFYNNEAEACGALFLSMSNVTIDKSNFTENRVRTGLIGGAICQVYRNLTVSQCMFIKNSAYLGGAIGTYNGTLNITSGSLFYENTARAGGGGIASLNSTLIVRNSNFTKNTLLLSIYTYQAGGGIYLNDGSITLLNCSFINNSARSGGAIASLSGMVNVLCGSLFYGNRAEMFGGVIFSVSTIVVINGSQLNNNIVGSHGTHSMLHFYNCSIAVKNVSVSDNYGSLFIFNSDISFQGQVVIRNNLQQDHPDHILNSIHGGVVTLIQSNALFFGHNRFESNEAENGGAVYSSESKLYVRDDFIMVDNKANSNGGGMYLYQSELICQMEATCHINISGNTASQNGGGIHAIGSIIKVTAFQNKTAIIFHNNSAEKGGGLFMEINAKLYVFKSDPCYSRMVLSFTENSAEYGGAVYVNDGTYFATCYRQDIECFVQVITIRIIGTASMTSYEQCNVETITFRNNHAKSWTCGPNLFGGLLHRCTVSPYEDIVSISHVHFNDIKGIDYVRNITNLGLNQTSSPPVSICPCINQQPNCTIKQVTLKVKKGEGFNVSLVAVDHVGHPVPAEIQSSFSKDSTSLEGQLKQTIDGKCSKLRFNIISSQDHLYETLSLYASDGPCKDAPSSRFNITISFLPCTCPVGFQPSKNSKVNCTCECHEDIALYVNECHVEDETFVKRCNSTNVWISSISKDEYVIYPNCPYDYCISSCSNSRFTFNQTNDLESAGQCSFNRSKLLCGSCKPGFSLSLGSSQCLHCPKHWPALFVLITIAAAIAGVALVAVLLMLNMTVAVGTLNGLIFYANILSTNKNIFILIPESTNFITIVISWLNMDIGINRCYIEGMDTYAKTWLQLVFLLYIYFLVVMTIIFSSYSSRFSKLLGKGNPVATLATVILICYAKLLEISFRVLSIGIVNYPNNTLQRVWLPDATVEYFGWKYTLLFFVSVIILFLGLIYTVLLFSWQWLLRLPKWRIFKWVKNQKLHVFMESYHVPYNPKHRYWTGLLLFARAILYLVAATNVSNDRQRALTSIILVVGTICLLKGLIVGRLYRNKLVDAIETIFYFSIIACATLTWYGNDKNLSRYNWAIIISVLVAIVMLLLIILYHFYVYTPVFSKLHKTIVGKKLDAMLIAMQTTVEVEQFPEPDNDIHAFNEFLDLVSGPASTNDCELQSGNEPAEPTETVLEIPSADQ